MKAEYRGVSGVARRVTKEYRGINGVARRITKAYRGISGIARQYFGTSYKILFEVYNADTSNNTDLGSTAGFENGYIKLRSYATCKSNTQKRVYSRARIPCSGDSGKVVKFTYTLSSSPMYHDGVINFLGSNESIISNMALSTGTNTVSLTIPSNIEKILFDNGLGTAGTYDILFTITSLSIGDEKII